MANKSRDLFFLRHCNTLAQNAVKRGNHPFGACLVDNIALDSCSDNADEALLQKAIRWSTENQVISRNDPTRHAELGLISDAGSSRNIDFKSVTLYTSTEPCIMCCGAIYWSGIPRVVYGCSHATLGKHAGNQFLADSRGILQMESAAHKIAVDGPLLDEEGDQIHKAFWSEFFKTGGARVK